MNAQRAEGVVQIGAVLGIWIVCFVGWAFKTMQAKSFLSYGADLPAPTLFWFEFADSWMALVFPTISTILIVLLIWRRSVHLNWVTVSLLFLGMSYGVIGQTVAILPSFRMCGAV